MCEDILKNLTRTQSRAVAHRDGPCLCLAGPGSGKTTVITNRTKYLVQKYRVNPMEILVITFTKAAAVEMQERFGRAMGGKRVPVTFGTFHSVFFWILRQAYHYTPANILREEQKYQYLKEIIDRLDLEIEDEGDFISGITAEISMVKNDRISLEHYYSRNCPEEVFRKIYREYHQKLERAGLLDFDDMLVYCYELLSQRRDILEGWQNRFRYILIDEFQDINQIQYDIVKMLAKPANNLFIVGDDDQSIYRFRGARPEIMLNFRKDYPEAEVILLEENFRSTENIIKGAGKVISCNRIRYKKEIHGVKGPGDKIELHGFVNPPQENTYLVKKVQDYIREGYTWKDIAVLFRTNTAGRLAVEKFMEYNLPFRMRDTMPNIYEHWITRNILSYIKMAMGNRERKEFLQIMNRPKRYISREAADAPKISFEELRIFYEEKEWMQDRIDKFENDLLLLKNMTPYAAINYIRHGVGYEEYLTEYAQYRKIRPEELYEVLNELQEAARNFKTYEEWFRHMEEYAKALQEQARQQKGEEDAVTFTTLHSSKGLEFPIVFIMDVNEGSIPHRKAVLDADLQEERRMFYVGMTRAKEHLHLYYVKEKYGKHQEVSRFIEELRR
ncbi:MAG: ATP-dependent helicase [Candidatus Limivivens sp.]|nr:ATP-dependent helicase [Candidatus Limivivens sp.]